MKQSDRLAADLQRYDRLTIAVSGGIDSMLLAYLAHKTLGNKAHMVHALSPAVPLNATKRVTAYARKHGWQLETIDAGEFEDERYRANPVNRCYYCKLNLYGTIAKLCDGPIASGTNCDDLDDYRPGLDAARRNNVVHPHVEAGLAKRDIYRMANQLGLDDLSVLPAQPCLASRIETGLAVHPDDLGFVEKVEGLIHNHIGVSAILRCRLLLQGVVLELDEQFLNSRLAPGLARMVEDLCVEEERHFLGLRAYRRGSAFHLEGRW